MQGCRFQESGIPWVNQPVQDLRDGYFEDKSFRHFQVHTSIGRSQLKPKWRPRLEPVLLYHLETGQAGQC